MDSDCQALGLCYQCIEMDLKSEGRDDCFPGMEEYNRPVRRDSSLEGALIACAEENEGGRTAKKRHRPKQGRKRRPPHGWG